MISWTRIITINNSQESGQSISTLCQKIVKNRPKLSNWNSLTAGITWLANIRMIRLWSHFQAINRFELTGENNPFWTSTVPNEINYHLSQKKTAPSWNHNLNNYRLTAPIMNNYSRTPSLEKSRTGLYQALGQPKPFVWSREPRTISVNLPPFCSIVEPLRDIYRCFVFFHNAFILIYLRKTKFWQFLWFFWISISMIFSVLVRFTRLQKWGRLIMHIHCSRNLNLEHDNEKQLCFIYIRGMSNFRSVTLVILSTSFKRSFKAVNQL